MEILKRAKTAIAKRLPKKLVTILVKTLGMSKIIPVPKNMNISSKDINNVFINGKRPLPMLRELITKEMEILIKEGRNPVTIFERLLKRWASCIRVELVRAEFVRAEVVLTKYK